MPIYEYACTTCRNRFEQMRSMDSFEEPAACPDCGSPSARVLSLFSAFVKGPGGELAPVAAAGGGCGCGGGACGCSSGVSGC